MQCSGKQGANCIPLPHSQTNWYFLHVCSARLLKTLTIIEMAHNTAWLRMKVILRNKLKIKEKVHVFQSAAIL